VIGEVRANQNCITTMIDQCMSQGFRGARGTTEDHIYKETRSEEWSVNTLGYRTVSQNGGGHHHRSWDCHCGRDCN